MQLDQRSENKRIDISRPVEIVNPKFGENIQGYIKNLSVGGMRARFDAALKPGDLVTLEIALAHDTKPVETKGEVIWCSPDSEGYGAEAGLKFLNDSESETAGRPTGDAWKSKMALLKPGQKVSIEAGGRFMPAVVEEVARSDEGASRTIRVSLVIEEGAVTETREIIDTTYEWESHRFEDFKNWCVERLVPAVKLSLRFALSLARLLGRGLVKIWAALPEKPRDRLKSIFFWKRREAGPAPRRD